MTYEELLKKHLDEIVDLENARDEAWKQQRERHDHIRNAFGNTESEIPEETRKQMQKDQEEFSKEWGHNGTRRKSLIIRQQMEKIDLNSHRLRQFYKGQKRELLDIEKGKNNGRDKDRDK